MGRGPRGVCLLGIVMTLDVCTMNGPVCIRSVANLCVQLMTWLEGVEYLYDCE